MKTKLYFFLCACFSILLTACGDDEPDVVSGGSRTVLAYIAADNSLAPFASLDLAEMKVGMAKVKDASVHLLVYIDNGSSARLLELKNVNGAVTEIEVKN